MITPASQWRKGLPSGNGTIGALVYGRINKKRIFFNHNELWYGGRIADVPDMSAELPVVRKLMLEGKYLEANDYNTNKLRELGIGANARYYPGEKNDVSASNPEVIEKLRKLYDLWWESVLPLMVNEDLPKVNPEDMPLAKRYYKQLKEKGIPNWSPEKID